MSRRLVALSSAAVAAVYAAGYVRTLPAAAQLAAAEAAPPAPPTPTIAPTPAAAPRAALRPSAPPRTQAPPPSRGELPQPVVPISPASPGLPPAAAAQAGAYKDGTFKGYGTSRRGDVEVAVTIESGRITSCQITRCLTQYPQSRINGLPAQVVARQTAAVDRVSGATYSTQAFRDAVAAALHQASA